MHRIASPRTAILMALRALLILRPQIPPSASHSPFRPRPTFGRRRRLGTASCFGSRPRRRRRRRASTRASPPFRPRPTFGRRRRLDMASCSWFYLCGGCGRSREEDRVVAAPSPTRIHARIAAVDARVPRDVYPSRAPARSVLGARFSTAERSLAALIASNRRINASSSGALSWAPKRALLYLPPSQTLRLAADATRAHNHRHAAATRR